jgi:hemimethylated DNA binding protein
MPRYTIGDPVRHRRYDYRAVIMATDAHCKADDAWYRRNRTQPSREQPWYHVLDDGGQERYVAEENLDFDDSMSGIDHPVVRLVFPTFAGGRYYRQSLN